MSKKEEITASVDELQAGVRVLIDVPCRVTINTREYRDFYDKIQSFVGRYNLANTIEWMSVDRWLIKKPNEYLTLEEAGHLKLALEKLRERAIVIAGEEPTEQDKKENERRIDEAFKEISTLGREQIDLLKCQISILESKSKSSQRWNWIMFIIALIGVIVAMVK